MAGGDRKKGNNKEVCKAYKAAGKDDANRKRRMRRHLRANPSDVNGRLRFEQAYGRADSLGLSARGKHVAKAIRKKRRAARKARAA